MDVECIEPALKTAEVFAMYQAQYSQVDKLWNYFAIVSLGVAGFVIGNDKASRSFKEPLVIIVGYICFCVGNYTALIDGHGFLLKIAKHYKTIAPKSIDVIPVIDICYVTTFYIICVAGTSIAIAVIAWQRNRDNPVTHIEEKSQS
jgi:hypothetical protein